MQKLTLGLVVALGLAAGAFIASPHAGAHAVDSTLSGTVGPGYSISMSATSVAPGTYTITIDDKSSIHNFHLSGPGVDEATDIEGTGTTTWTVMLQAGTYHFVCDAHASTMRGTLTVGDASAPPRTTTAPAAKPLAAHITAARATRKTVTVTVSSTIPGRAVAQLFADKRRVARAAGAVPGKLALHPAKPLAAGRYVVKLRVSAGGKSVATSRTVRVR
jgi:plastocyanin